jgi:lipopolysaccharide/colanic/teichoic acid biosynthesis glycosyltransferase
MLIVAPLIRVTSPGPAIFTQRRCGKHGEPFKSSNSVLSGSGAR